MLFTPTTADISTVSLRQQTTNGSCLVLGDKKQPVYWTTVISSWAVILVAIVLGLPGNVLSAVVFYKQGLRERINLCLFALAIVNLIVVLRQLLNTGESLYRYTIRPSWVLYQSTVCLQGFTWASQFLSAVIASERCFCVVSPFHAKRLLKTSTMAAIIVVCCVLIIGGMSAIVCPKHTTTCVFDPKTNAVEDIEFITEYYIKNKKIIDIFDIFIYTTALSGIFLVVIIVTSIITAIKLRAALAWRLATASKTTAATATTPTGEEAERRMTRKEVSVSLMLMVTSALFTVCMTANLVTQICILSVPGLSYNELYNLPLLHSIWLIVHLLWTLNSSLNFVVYYKIGSKFREMVKSLLGREPLRPTSKQEINTAYYRS